MTNKIGIFGSADDNKAHVIEKAQELGNILGKHKVTLITGACSGLPYAAAYEAAKHDVEIWGYSPELDYEMQKKAFPEDDSTIYTKLLYIPKDFPFAEDNLVCKKYRNIISTATCDAGIIISGRWGTMNEFTNLYDMGKIIGILTETGGIADELPQLLQKINKKSKAQVFFNDNPEMLVTTIIHALKKQ